MDPEAKTVQIRVGEALRTLEAQKSPMKVRIQEERSALQIAQVRKELVQAAQEPAGRWNRVRIREEPGGRRSTASARERGSARIRGLTGLREALVAGDELEGLAARR